MIQGLKLRKFKKLKEDNHFVHLVHMDGHQMVIAKHALNGLQKKQLEHLEPYHYDDGGAVGDPQEVQKVEDLDENDPALNTPQAPSQNNLQVEPLSAPPSTSNKLDIEPLSASDRGPPSAQPEMTDYEAATGEKPQAIQEHGKGLSLQADEYRGAAPPPPSEPSATLPAMQELPAYKGNQQDIFNKYLEKDAELEQSYKNGTVDPDKLISPETKNKNDPWLGVIISSLGQAIGQGRVPVNVALQQLNQNTQDEITKQKMGDDKNLNLWKMNRQLLGTDLAADVTTQNQLNTANRFNLDRLAAQTNNAKTIAETNVINKQLKLQDVKNAQMMSIMQNPAATVADKLSVLRENGKVTPEHAKTIAEQADQSRYIVQNGPAIITAFDQMAAEAKQPRSNLPGSRPQGGSDAFQALIGPTLQGLEGSARQGLLESLGGHLGVKGSWTFGLTNDTDQAVASKRNALLHYLGTKGYSTLAESHGIRFRDNPETDVPGMLDKYAAPKPNKVEQGDHTYILNPVTGKYE